MMWPTEEWSAAARDSGAWRPAPFQQFSLKLHGWCNLACDYCYVYEMADQSWRDRPRKMDPATVERAAFRIAEHVVAHGVEYVNVVFHGGEPLLAGREAVAHAARSVRAALPSGTELSFRLQTNGTLLTDEVLDVLLAEGIAVGVSLDGDPRAHDRHRRYAGGRASHAEVTAGLPRLRAEPYRELSSHLYCVVDVANDPVQVYESLLEFGPPVVDFLLPDGTWSTPPPLRVAGAEATPYADWLIAVFERWYGAPQQETGVRFFESIIQLVLGGQSRVDSVGLSPNVLVVVETDGTIEQVDTLKSGYEGAAGTGLNVFDHPFDRALEHPGMAARQAGAAALCETCVSCPVARVCGGGYYAHRYREGTGYLNPSVYCPDLFKLITHIHERVQADLRLRAS
ncbi:FxsB family cyclophane-forming radical SAM/SPASM peptide maturase [Nonomuraea sp. B5E05]|uniref:FxsB family cyclophane-forming radical SAM/SPASM peptide maturase n=1 Tax=Nonomuraea sp. B5E05 TaxID=3153569 RepID=UPI003261440F